MDEKRAVVAPFVQGARADDRQIEAAFGELKTTELLPSDKALIAEALQSTKTITPDEAKSAADWIERENPSLAQIEAAADKAAEVGTQPVPAQSP